MKSQKFINTRTGEVVTQIPLSEIQHFEEINDDAAAFVADHLEIISITVDEDGTSGQDRDNYTDDQDRDSYEVTTQETP